MSTIKPADGQILGDINEALNAVVDQKGEKIDFKRNEDVKDDLVYVGEGSDGRTYQIQLQHKMVIVSVFETPPKPKQIKTKVGTSSKSSSDNNKDTKDKDKDKDKDKKEDLNKIVEKLDKPLLEKKDKEGAKKQ